MDTPLIRTDVVPLEPCPVLSGDGVPQEYLGDESKLRASGVAWIAFPENLSQLSWLMRENRRLGRTVVFSGGRTGVAGGAAPIETQMLASLERMNRILELNHGAAAGEYELRVEPGVRLAAVMRALSRRRLPGVGGLAQEYRERKIPALWLPVNPTEQSAHLGGAVANNASGARTYRYGSLRAWVTSLTVVLANGEVLRLRRGGARAHDGRFILQMADGEERCITVPDLPPPRTKRTCGYETGPEMELIDLFIGSEGTLGAVAEVGLRLVARPEDQAGVIVFCPDESAALRLADAARTGLCADALEYFDCDTLALIRAHVPGRYRIPEGEVCAVCLEFSGAKQGVTAAMRRLQELLLGQGLGEACVWAADQPAELARQQELRHTAPEAVNALIARRKTIHPAIHKIGTDMAVPASRFCQMLAHYRTGLRDAGLQSVVFGHLGDGHVHVNILPQDPQQLAASKALYEGWARIAAELGGAVAAEHGIGRLKRNLLALQYPPQTLTQMRALRCAFDPEGLLAPGVLL